MHLILASASPRRADLLTAAGFQFEVHPVEADERSLPDEKAGAYVRRVAIAKERAWPLRDAREIVLAADTVVVVDDLILGKPVDAADAARMLRLLSGRSHEVLTGLALRHGEREVSAVEVSRVRFLPLSEDEIAWYVASGEPQDKAGAYAVQGLASRFVEGIEGSYANVVGLPVSRFYQLLGDLVGAGCPSAGCCCQGGPAPAAEGVRAVD